MLAIASFLGSYNIVEFLIQRSAYVNQVDSLKNRTALHWAVASGHYEIAKLLIEAGKLKIFLMLLLIYLFINM
jgi:ankyrin repeat protein